MTAHEWKLTEYKDDYLWVCPNVELEEYYPSKHYFNFCPCCGRSLTCKHENTQNGALYQNGNNFGKHIKLCLDCGEIL